jgi:hypothetical protein
MGDEENGWDSYKKLILFQLDKLTELAEEHSKLLTKIESDIGLLKFKAGLIGAIAGLVSTAIITIVIKLILNL